MQKASCMLLFLLVGLIHKSSGQVISYYPTNGLIHCFPFSGNANDVSANAAIGVVSKATLTTDRFGNCNEAYSFSGANAYIATHSTLLNNLNHFTVSFWIKIDEYPVAGSYVFAKGKEEPVLGDRLSWRCYLGGNPYKYIGTDNWFPVRYATTNKSTTTDWIQIVISNDGSKQRVYINGIPTDSIAQTGTLRTNPDSLYIGTRSLYGNRNQFFKGKLDEIVLWNRALSYAEVVGIYNASSFLANQPELVQNQDTTIECGASFNFRAATGYSYLWSPSSGLSNPLAQNPIVNAKQTTLYILKASKNGCDKFDSVLVTVNQPTIQLNRSESICLGDSVMLQASGAQSYGWRYNTTLSDTSIANPFAKPLVTTKYYLKAIVNGCTVIDSVMVTLVNNLQVNAGSDTSLCKGSALQLNATGGSRFAWSPNIEINDTTISNPTITATQSRWYKVQSTSGTCEAKDSLFVTFNDNPTIHANDTVVCGLNNVFTPIINATAADNYLWQPSNYLSSANLQYPQISPKSSITYIIKANNSTTGCSAIDTMFVLLGNPVADFTTPVPIVIIPETVSLTNSSNPNNLNYAWYLDETYFANTKHSQVNVYEEKSYHIKLVVTDSLGCMDSTTKLVEGKSNAKIFIPNVFTPNGDNANDVFSISFVPGLYLNFEGSIWNRWGQQITTFDALKGNWWDGTFEGKFCPDGVYFYIINTTNINNESKTYWGTLTLIR